MDACRREANQVAPHAGAWIEIAGRASMCRTTIVAPHAGAWIEIISRKGRGNDSDVAPHAGAWIEMPWHPPS